MPYYEVIYEPGTKAICFYEDDDECQSALAAHKERALAGEPATPESSTHPDEDAPAAVGTWAAERPIKVLVRETHPADYEPEVDTTKLEGTNLEMLEQLRSQINPTAEAPGAQDSQYKMEVERELELPA